MRLGSQAIEGLPPAPSRGVTPRNGSSGTVAGGGAGFQRSSSAYHLPINDIYDQIEQRVEYPAATTTTNAHRDISSYQQTIHEQRVRQEIQQEVEGQFRAKYNALKQVYEAKIRDLSSVVHKLCDTILEDETLSELRRDSVGLTFIPQHITEIFETHLKSERERNVHANIEKIAQLQLELANCRSHLEDQTHHMRVLDSENAQLRVSEQHLEPLKTKLRLLQEEFESLSNKSEEDMEKIATDRSTNADQLQSYKHQVQQLMDSNATKEKQLQSLNEELSVRKADLMKVQHQLELQSKELKAQTVINTERESLLKSIQQQFATTNAQNKDLNIEMAQMKSNHIRAQEELHRVSQLLEHKTVQESECTRKLQTLMSQVENILNTENEENNQVIVNVHEQMKQLRHKYAVELQREKRTNSALLQELTDARHKVDETNRECAVVRGELANWQHLLQKEKELVIVLTTDAQKLKDKLQNCETRLLHAEEKVLELEKSKDREVKLAEHRIKLECLQQLQVESSQFREREQLMKLRYDNDVTLLQSQQHIHASTSMNQMGGLPEGLVNDNMLQRSFDAGINVGMNLVNSNANVSGLNNSSHERGVGSSMLFNNRNGIDIPGYSQLHPPHVSESFDNNTDASFSRPRVGQQQLVQLQQANLKLKQSNAQNLDTIDQQQRQLAEAGEHINKLKGMVTTLRSQLSDQSHLNAELRSVIDNSSLMADHEAVDPVAGSESRRHSSTTPNPSASNAAVVTNPTDGNNAKSAPRRLFGSMPTLSTASTPAGASRHRYGSAATEERRGSAGASKPLTVDAGEYSQLMASKNKAEADIKVLKSQLADAKHQLAEASGQLANTSMQLSDTQERALAEQQQQQSLLQQMQQKFIALMQKYEAAVATNTLNSRDRDKASLDDSGEAVSSSTRKHHHRSHDIPQAVGPEAQVPAGSSRRHSTGEMPSSQLRDKQEVLRQPSPSRRHSDQPAHAADSSSKRTRSSSVSEGRMKSATERASTVSDNPVPSAVTPQEPQQAQQGASRRSFADYVQQSGQPQPEPQQPSAAGGSRRHSSYESSSQSPGRESSKRESKSRRHSDVPSSSSAGARTSSPAPPPSQSLNLADAEEDVDNVGRSIIPTFGSQVPSQRPSISTVNDGQAGERQPNDTLNISAVSAIPGNAATGLDETSLLQSKLQMLQTLEETLTSRIAQQSHIEQHLQTQIQTLTKQLDILSADVKHEQSRKLFYQKRAQSLESVVNSVQLMSQASIQTLKTELLSIRGEVSTFNVQANTQLALFGESFKEFAVKHMFANKEIQDTMTHQEKIILTNAFTAEKQAQERAFSEKISRLISQHEQELQAQREELLRQANSALQAGDNGSSSSFKIASRSKTGRSMINLDDSNILNTSGVSSQRSRRHTTASASEGINNTSISSFHSTSNVISGDSPASAFESVLVGVCDALSENELVTSEISAKLMAIAKEHTEPSFAATTLAKNILSESLHPVCLQIHEYQMQKLHHQTNNHVGVHGHDVDKRVSLLQAEIDELHAVHHIQLTDMKSENQVLAHQLLTARSQHSKAKHFFGADADTPRSTTSSNNNGEYLDIFNNKFLSSSLNANSILGGGGLDAEQDIHRQFHSELLDQRQAHKETVDDLQQQIIALTQRAQNAEMAVVTMKMQS
jgi:hypothetical protein